MSIFMEKIYFSCEKVNYEDLDKKKLSRFIEEDEIYFADEEVKNIVFEY